MCKGETQRGTVPDIISNDIYPDGDEQRQAGYGLVRFEGQLDQDNDPGHRRPELYPSDDTPNNRPLRFEDTPSYTNQNNPNPSSTTQNIVSFKDDTNYNNNGNTFNQIPGQKKRRKRRWRKSRRFMGVRDIKYGPGGQPIIPFHDPTAAPKPNFIEMSGPLRVISDALGSIIENDEKLCVRRMLCEQAATNDQIHSSPLLQTALTVFQYIPLLRNAAINALPLANSVGLISLAMRYGATSRNVSACQQRYPQCPDDPEERIHYLNNHRGGIFRFFRGNDQHQYTATEFHNQLLQLGLNPQPNPANTYGFYQPQYGSTGQQLANPYLSHNSFQTPTAPGQYGLIQQNFPTNSQNSYLNNVRAGKQLKFPYEENVQEAVKHAKGFSFPGAQSNRQYAEFPGDILADDDLRIEAASDVGAPEGIQAAVDDEGESRRTLDDASALLTPPARARLAHRTNACDISDTNTSLTVPSLKTNIPKTNTGLSCFKIIT
ncbi:hypothetical protein NE865_02162 [Phthorimaea operculella]|nr:hypothetical protein NE865_02162 [Phthorimaea operculella]